ncbi:MAG TPA: hypothetical protein VGI66_12580 [Streptosporangiaceae bacterium]|jgi:hypothetical protein
MRVILSGNGSPWPGTVSTLIANDLVPATIVYGVINMLIIGIGHIFGVGGPPPVITA